MKNTNRDDSRIAFFGKITASITHEMKNVLAIIKESSGLMEDILAFSKDGILSHEEKMKDAIQTIGEQIKRGGELTSRLNRFAHDSDDRTQSVDLNDLAVHLAALSGRFARLKRIALVVVPSQGAMAVVTCPQSLLMALFTGIECCFSAMPSGGRIDIEVGFGNGEKGISLSCHGPDAEEVSFATALVQDRQWTLFLKRVDVTAGRHDLDAMSRRLTVFLPDVMDTENRARETSR